MTRFIYRLAAIIALTTLTISNAHAYLDPGTGSALIQGLIAAVALLGVTLKAYWFRILAFFSPNKKQDDEARPEETAPDKQA